MAQLDPDSTFQTVKDRTVEAVSSHFPFEGSHRTLELHKAWVEDDKNIDDIRTQQDAKLKGRSWDVPLKAEISLKDKKTGKEIDRQVVTVAKIPKITRRYSYIVDGKERQVENQFRLKAGAYHRENEAGELNAHWNLEKWEGSKASRFNTYFDPKSRKFQLEVDGTRDIGLYGVLRALGKTDDQIKKSWGKDIHRASVEKYGSEAKQLQSLNKLLNKTTGKISKTLPEARTRVAEVMGGAKLRPDSTKTTLGKSFEHVNGDAMLTSSSKLLQLARGEVEADDRESLKFKDLLSVEDHLSDRLQRGSWDIKRRLKQTVDTKDRVREVVNPVVFNKPLKSFFSTELAPMPTQTNPLDFVSGHMRTTIMGKGGISDIQSVPEDALRINPSHLGFIDPIPTPEGEKTGITLQLPLGVKKRGKELITKLYSRKTGKLEELTPAQFDKAIVAFPDQVDWKGGRPLPKSKEVTVASRNNDIEARPYGEVTHVMPSTKGMYSLPTNLVPFLQNNQSNRAMTATRMQEQAVGLKEREAPLVQSATGSPGGTFEKVMGSFNSHSSPVNGTVVSIDEDSINVKDSSGKIHEVQIYNDFPLNQDQAFIKADTTAKVGQTVKKGQLLADTNFTKNGEFALGKNLRVGYMPYKGGNFEDGIVISETAAKKLTSEHLYRPKTGIDKKTVLSKKKFRAHVASDFMNKEQWDKLDDDGVIKPGMMVEEGDVLVAKLQREDLTTEQQKLRNLKKSMVKDHRNRAVVWDKGYEGKVSRVARTSRGIEVHVKTSEPAQIGDKLVGRHGNKGIISTIMPDHEMVVLPDGKPLEIAMNPAGVPSRINLGQVLETVAGKIARKTGKPYVVDNFNPNEPDYTAKVMKDLKAHGLKDTDEVRDPKTGRILGEVLNGEQYIFKLKHKVSKSMSPRSGGAGNPYTMDKIPKAGTGAQSMGALGMYAMLSHGARANIREMTTLKSDRNDELWTRLQEGASIPAPKVPFTYDKFTGYLKVMGINIEKKGNIQKLVPMTDKEIRKTSSGALVNGGKMLRGKDLRPEKGGLFDNRLTGGVDGTKWSHIELSEPIPNPTFEKAITGLLGLKAGHMESVISGEKTLGDGTGPSAIVSALSQINVKKDLAQSKLDLTSARKDQLNKARKKVRYLQALSDSGISPVEAYTTKAIPVMPPVMRPVTVMDNGDLNTEDLNHLYKDVALADEKLRELNADKGVPEFMKTPMRASVYDGLKALNLTGSDLQGRHRRGVMEAIAGKQPKYGYFQEKIIGRRQDLTMRSTIIPDQSMELDEVGLPRKAAMEMMKPFVVRELVQGFGYTPLKAQKAIRENKPIALKALEQVAVKRPVILKRDPVLHRHGVMAFKPKIVAGKAIQIHPLVTAGYNADFDGDKMGVFVPLTHEAVEEAKGMFPSKHLHNPATGSLMHMPRQEGQLGVYQLSQVGKKTKHFFKSKVEALRALKNREISVTDQISVGDVSSVGLTKTAGPTATTAGRLILADTMPKDSEEQARVMGDMKMLLNSDGLGKLLKSIAGRDSQDFARSVNKLNQAGNQQTYDNVFSFGLKDFQVHKDVKDAIFAEADKEVKALRKKGVSRNDAIVQAYMKAVPKIDTVGKAKMKRNDNKVFEMVSSGARGNWDQFKQITIAPVLVADDTGKAIPIPLKKSYSEGLSTAEYWASLSGARMGTLAKVKGTSEPGGLTKVLVNTSINQIVVDEDCGTQRGISMNVDDPEIQDRYLASTAKVRGTAIPSGTLLTPELLNKLRNAKAGRISVRSPLKCEHGEGLCGKCYGIDVTGQIPSPGTNLGIIAAQGVGEPATQLSMRKFHTGGVVEAKGDKMDDFTKLQALLTMPKNMRGSATISSLTGSVSNRGISKDPAGGWRVSVKGKDRHGHQRDQEHYIPGNRRLGDRLALLKERGGTMKIKAGQPLSSGIVNPRDLLEVAGMERVRNYLTDEMHGAYKDMGVKRKNMEVMVRSIANLTEVRDPGDSGFMRGDVVPATLLSAKNRKAVKAGQNPALHKPILKGINEVPLEMQEDWLARLQYQKLKDTVLEGSAQGWESDLHGLHPIPGMAFGKEFGQPERHGNKKYKY
jgi:DNA-directed RNA polymerase subunit beta'